MHIATGSAQIWELFRSLELAPPSLELAPLSLELAPPSLELVPQRRPRPAAPSERDWPVLRLACEGVARKPSLGLSSRQLPA